MKTFKMTAVVSLLLLFLCPSLIWGAKDIVDKWDFKNVKKESVQVPISEPDKLTHEYRMTQEKYKLYECIILSLAVVSCLFIILRFLTRTSYSANHIVNAAGLVFIVFGTIFVVILSDVDQQLTGAMGIMGAVAGYLFGTMRRGEGEASQPAKKE